MKIIAIGFILISLLYGDVMYQIETKTQMSNMGSSEAVIRNFIKGDKMRTEVKAKNPILGEFERFTIIRLDKGVSWLLDYGKKEYTEIPLDLDLTQKSIPDLTTTMPEIKIERFNETKEILKVKCEKYVVTMELKSDGDHYKLIQTMWVGKDFNGYDEIKSFNKKILNRLQPENMLGFNKKIFERFQEKIAEIDGVPFEIELDLNIQEQGKEIVLKSTSLIKQISTVPISDRVFEIPDGFKPTNSQKTN